VIHKPALPGARTRAFVAWSLRHGRLLWTLALLFMIPAGLLTARLYLHLRSDLEELLPRDAPSVRALDELRARVPGLQFLGVLVDVGSPVGSAEHLAAGERFLDDLATRVRQYPPALVRRVRVGYAAERDFIEQHLPLYLETGDLEAIRSRLDDRMRFEYAKETGMLLDENEPPPSLDFSDIEHKYDDRLDKASLTGGRFSSPKLGLTLMLVEVGSFHTGNTQARELLGRVRHDIAELGGLEHYGQGMRLGFTGDVTISVEELSALVVDLTFSSVLVVLLVVLVLVLYYRWLRSVVALFVPLVVGALSAFALASLPPFGITSLNSNTAFLGSIIIGNGINFGIILLARYVEARRGGASIEESLALALTGTRIGTLSAALAAAAAYASLIAMQFRGFHQFGIIGGLGMVLCWGATFLLMPSLVAWLDGGRLHVRAVPSGFDRPMSVLANGVAARPGYFLLAAACITLLALFEVRRFGHDQLEYDFSHLRRKDTWISGEGYWGKRMDTLLGRQVTPTVILADDVEQTRAIAARLREAIKQPPLVDMVSQIQTGDDVLPLDQAKKIAIANAIKRKLTPRIRASISETWRGQIDRFLGAENLAEVSAGDLPNGLWAGLQEYDGNTGRIILVFPRPSEALWHGPDVARFVGSLREVVESVKSASGKTARVAGGPPLTADILRSMGTDGPLASLFAFAGVVATVLLLFRRSIASPFVIGSLVVGVLWMLAATIALGVKINFINLIAFPITFGIGVDYAVNVMGRYLQDGSNDITAAVRATGGAVGLCSMTTIIGYSSLLVAKNRGLYLFGLVAVLGEIACLTTAVVVLPAALLVYQRRRQKREAGALPESSS
jgi:predicted RND superfamily exporter protein